MEGAAAEGKKNVLQGPYELGLVLGHGNFGRVHAARDLRTGHGLAVKVVAKDKVERAGMEDQIKREIAVMKMVSHPNILELHEVMATRSKIYLALELVRGGELFVRISRAGRLREDVARHYFRELISAVDFCHDRGVYHRDLKPENLLLDEAGNLKVADFGLNALAGHARPDGLLHTFGLRCLDAAWRLPLPVVCLQGCLEVDRQAAQFQPEQPHCSRQPNRVAVVQEDVAHSGLPRAARATRGRAQQQ